MTPDDIAVARAALARHDRGRCNVRLREFDNDAVTGHCARWLGHDDDHSGWPDEEGWPEYLRAALAHIEALTAAR